MPLSEDLIIRRAVIATVDGLPQTPDSLRARTLARFRSEAAGLGTSTAPEAPAAGRSPAAPTARLLALVLGFLPAFAAAPVAATLGIEQPLTLRDAIVGTRSLGLVSRLLRIA